MKCKKEDILTFLNVLGEYFIPLEKVDMCFNKRAYGSYTSSAIHMRPVQN